MNVNIWMKNGIYLLLLTVFSIFCVGCQKEIIYEPPSVKEEGSNIILTDSYYRYSAKIDKAWKVYVLAKDKESQVRFKVSDADDKHAVLFMVFNSNKRIDINILQETVAKTYSLGTIISKRSNFGMISNESLEVKYENANSSSKPNKKVKGRNKLPEHEKIQSLAKYTISQALSGGTAYIQIAQAKDGNLANMDNLLSSFKINKYDQFFYKVKKCIKPDSVELFGGGFWIWCIGVLEICFYFCLLLFNLYIFVASIYYIFFIIRQNHNKHRIKKIIKNQAGNLISSKHSQNNINDVIESLYGDHKLSKKDLKYNILSVFVFLVFALVAFGLACILFAPIPVVILSLLVIPFVILGLISKQVLPVFEPFLLIIKFLPIPIPIPHLGDIFDHFHSSGDGGDNSSHSNEAGSNHSKQALTSTGQSSHSSIQKESSSPIPSGQNSSSHDIPQKPGNSSVLDDKLSKTSSSVSGESKDLKSSSQLDDKLSRTDSSR